MTLDSRAAAVIGWRERVALPQLGVEQIKAKIDTGARSSALHAFDLEPFERQGTAMVRFKVHPLQRSTSLTVTAEAPVLDRRMVRDSGGHSQLRYCIETQVAVGPFLWPIELTLTSRDAMGFRLLLGRQAVRRRFLVDAGRSYLQGQSPLSSQTID